MATYEEMSGMESHGVLQKGAQTGMSATVASASNLVTLLIAHG